LDVAMPTSVRIGTAGDARSRNDLPVFNHWLSLTRLRAAGAVAVFAVVLHFLPFVELALAPVLGVCVVLCAFSIIALRSQVTARAPWLFFYLQHIVDVSGITVGIAVAVAGFPALLFRPLFVMVIVPASLVSIAAGLFVAAAATLGHEVLLGLERGFAPATFVSLESLVPAFLFFLVAQQSFFYGGHLERKNAALGRLADQLEDSGRQLTVLVDVARTLNSTLEAPTLLARVNRIALDQLEADWSATFLVDSSRRTFKLATSTDRHESAPRAVPAVELPTTEWPGVERLADERVVALTDVEVMRTRELLAAGRQVTAVVLAGLYRDDALTGILAVGYRVADASLREAAVERLGAIAEHATIALRNAQLLDEARHASALKSEFVSTVSHELRTPLNVITGYVEMLLDGAAGPLTEEQRGLVDRVDARSRELLELIEATLQVGRFEARSGTVELTPVALGDLLRALDGSIAGLPCPATVAFVWDVPATAAGTMVTDRAAVALIVRNLVSNAFKFTESGAVTVRIRAASRTLVVEVIDTGIGMSPQDVPTAFDSFRQLDTSTTRRHGGVGLGLYIVKQFVDRLGGTVEVDSTPGHGTAFRVVLPGYAADAPALSSEAA
jgi:signal transduction histidine kinase